MIPKIHIMEMEAEAEAKQKMMNTIRVTVSIFWLKENILDIKIIDRQGGYNQGMGFLLSYQLLKMEKKENKLKRQKEAVEEPEPTMEEEDNQEDFEDQFEGEVEGEEEEWVSEGEFEGEEEEYNAQEKQAFTGNNKKLGEGEHLEVVNRAYDMLFRTSLQWPCLSIDFVVGENPFETKKLGFQEMNKYPYEITTVQGTQGEKKNQLVLAKFSKMHKTKYDDDSEDWEDEEDMNLDNDDEPEFAQATVDIKYAVNRIKSLNSSSIVAYWNENAELSIMDLSKKYRQLQQGLKNNPKEKIVPTIFQSSAEGFALNWNPSNTGQLAAGNMSGEVAVVSSEGLTKWVSDGLYQYHKGSVEDLVFSPSEKSVFATCGVDGTIQIVDMRTGKNNQSSLLINAHSKDVNVIDWNSVDKTKIVSGSDDCSVKIWDLRFIGKSPQKQNEVTQSLCCFKWHEEPITSVVFQPNDSSTIAVASEDNRITIWDLGVQNKEAESGIPNELMFIHQGQEEIKEIRFHPIYYEMLVSTASNGINIFKPCFTGGDDDDDEGMDEPIQESELEDYLNKLSIS